VCGSHVKICIVSRFLSAGVKICLGVLHCVVGETITEGWLRRGGGQSTTQSDDEMMNYFEICTKKRRRKNKLTDLYIEIMHNVQKLVFLSHRDYNTCIVKEKKSTKLKRKKKACSFISRRLYLRLCSIDMLNTVSWFVAFLVGKPTSPWFAVSVDKFPSITWLFFFQCCQRGR
jgi:hypothetical protein